jgi:hypothetical protein
MIHPLVTVNKISESMRKGYVAVTAALSVSYFIPEYVPGARDVLPAYFDHAGNATFSYLIAMLGTYGIARAIGPHEETGSKDKNIHRLAAACSLVGSAAVNALCESSMVAANTNLVADRNPSAKPHITVFRASIRSGWHCR